MLAETEGKTNQSEFKITIKDQLIKNVLRPTDHPVFLS